MDPEGSRDVVLEPVDLWSAAQDRCLLGRRGLRDGQESRQTGWMSSFTLRHTELLCLSEDTMIRTELVTLLSVKLCVTKGHSALTDEIQATGRASSIDWKCQDTVYRHSNDLSAHSFAILI